MRRIRFIDYHIVTVLSTKEVAVRFREAIRGGARGFAGIVGRALLEWDFFTPESPTDPFADLEEPEDEPAFCVGASYGLRQRRYRTAFEDFLQAGVGGAAVLTIWDKGRKRVVELRHQGDLSPASKKCVKAVIDSLSAGDPSATIAVEEGSIRA